MYLTQIALDVGAGGNGLRLQRLDLAKRGRIELVRHHAAEILLERELVDNRQPVARVTEHLERPSIGTGLDLERYAGGLDAHTSARRHHQQDVTVELDRHAVLQVGLPERATGARIEGEDGRKRRGTRGPLLNRERPRRPDRHGGGVLIQADPNGRFRRRLRGSRHRRQEQSNEGKLAHAPWCHSRNPAEARAKPSSVDALPGMRPHGSITRAGCLVASLALASNGCGLVGPSCTDETGTVLNVNGQVAEGGTAAYTVMSPKSSNLLMRLTWGDTAVPLNLRGTITACGGHVGCSMGTIVPPFGPGGTSPVPLPWPPGLREMLVDGWEGKTYLIEVTNAGERDASFALQVTYQIRCES